MSASQPAGSSPRRLRSQLARQVGKGLRVRAQARRSTPLRSRAPRATASRKCASAASGTRNGGSTGQPRFCLVRRTSSTPSGEPCASKRVLLVRRAVADVRAHEDQRRPRRFGARRLQRRVDRVEVVAVGDRRRVPAVGLEALRAILGERDVGAGRKRDVSCRRTGRSACRAAGGRRATPLPTATPSIRSPSLTIA